MAASNKNLKIEFTGDLSGLSIVLNGKTFYMDKENGKNKERSPSQKKAQIDHSVSATFAGCVHKIPILKRVWHKVDFKKIIRTSRGIDSDKAKDPGKAEIFNKIISANRKIKQDTDHPTSANKFVPENHYGMPGYNAVLLADELIVKINLIKNNDIMEFSTREQKLTAALIISAYDPKTRSKTKFEVFPRWDEIEEFTPSESCQFIFPLDAIEKDILKKYKNCYLYFTIVTETSAGRIIRCFNSHGVNSSLKGYPASPVHFTNEPTSNI